jgi:hypothetical protein
MRNRVPNYEYQPPIDIGTLARTANSSPTVAGARPAITAAPTRELAAALLASMVADGLKGDQRLAWQSPDHMSQTNSAMTTLTDIDWRFNMLPAYVAAVDATWGNVWGEVCTSDKGICDTGGNNAHFMKDKGQDNARAYKASVEIISSQAASASFALWYVLDNKKTWYKLTVGYDTDAVLIPLKDAVHALQDSFSPGHVTRGVHSATGAGAIKQIHLWNAENKKTHGDLDKQSGGILGQDSRDATEALINCVVEAAASASPKQTFDALFTPKVKDRFLRTDFPTVDPDKP